MTFYFRKGISMSEHPVVQEYLRAYNNVLDFKNRLTQVLMDKGIYMFMLQWLTVVILYQLIVLKIDISQKI